MSSSTPAPHFFLPRRISLVAQTAQSLRDGIAAGHWRESLPGERELCATLQVSRHTLRAALADLQRTAAITSTPRAPRSINQAPHPVRISARVVGVIARSPLRQMSPMIVLMIDALREYLGRSGWTLQIHVSPACFSRHPERALRNLVGRTPSATWLLLSSVRTMQEWFVRNALPCLVSGTCMPDIRLSCVDADQQAVAHHAGAMLLRKGHRRIALVRADEDTGGDNESEAGLRKALAAQPDANLRVLSHRGRDNLIVLLDQTLRGVAPPTAYFVLRATHALSVTMHLLRRGVVVPGNAAVVSRDDEGFLEHTSPRVTRYGIDPVQFARQMMRLIRATSESGMVGPRVVRLMPRFVPGETV